MGTDRSLSSRNFGIDLLRVVAMFYVVTLHCIGPGGILNAAEIGSAQYHTAWFLEIWTYCAVDIFALISGYVSYSEEHKAVKWSNYLLLWLQVVVYGAGVVLLFHFINPELVTLQDLFRSFFPVSNGLYWYVTAYTGLFVVMPLLNAGLRSLSEPSARKFFFGSLLVFSLYETFFQKFTMAAGYSFLWISILYILGACIKKCGIGKDLKPRQAVLGILLLCLVTWVWKMAGPAAGRFSRDMLVSYVSPTVLGCALLHLIWFSKLTFGPGMRRFITFAAPAAFAAYILNCHKLIWAHVVVNQFAGLAARPLPVLVGYVVVFSLVFVGISILIDRARIWVFDLLHLRKAADRLVGCADHILTKRTSRF